MFKINKIQYNIIGLKQTSIENRLSNHVAQLLLVNIIYFEQKFICSLRKICGNNVIRYKQKCPWFFFFRKNRKKWKSNNWSKGSDSDSSITYYLFILAAIQGWFVYKLKSKRVFQIISFYFGPDQKIDTFACNWEHTH